MEACTIILAMLSMGIPALRVIVPKVWRTMCVVKGKGYASSEAQCFKIRVIGGIPYEREQCFSSIAVELLHQPYGLGQQFDTAEYACLVAVELQPKTSLIITEKMLLAKFHQITIGSTCITGKEENIPCRFHFLLQVLKVESLQFCLMLPCPMLWVASCRPW